MTKIDSCLSNVVAYQMSVRLLNKSTIEKLTNKSYPFCGLVVPTRENTTMLSGNGFTNQKVKLG